MASDTLLLRTSHYIKSKPERWSSVARMARYMRYNDHDAIQKRVDYLVSKGLVSKKEGRVYNGLPIALYAWTGE